MSSGGTLDLTTVTLSPQVATLGSLADAAGPQPTGHQVVLNSTILNIGGDNKTTTFSGAISSNPSAGGLNKLGTGVFTYGGNASLFTGTASVASGGTLQMGTGATGYDASLGASSLANSGGLIYNVAVSQTAAYSIKGSGTLLKTGPGTLMLNGSNTYTGATSVNNGIMQLISGGVLANTSTVSVLSGGNLQVASGGTVAAAVPVNVNSGGVLSITAPTAQVLSSTITLQPGGVLSAAFTPGFQLGAGQTLNAGRTSSPATDIVGNMTVAGGVLNVGSGTLMACNGGSTLSLSGGSVNLNLTSSTSGANGLIDPSNLALSGVTTLDLNAVNFALGSGTYNLIDYTSLTSGGTSNLSLNLIGVALGGNRQTITLQTTPSAVEARW